MEGRKGRTLALAGSRTARWGFERAPNKSGSSAILEKRDRAEPLNNRLSCASRAEHDTFSALSPQALLTPSAPL